MGSHPFNFEGGDKLSTIGAAWFVSYAYYEKIDKTHTNWKNVSTVSNCQNTYHGSRCYHHFWLTKIVAMNDSRLNTNTIGLRAREIKAMAYSVLRKTYPQRHTEGTQMR